MTDAIGSLAASASLAQAHFGESPVSLSSRLVNLLNQELGQRVTGATVGMDAAATRTAVDASTQSVWPGLRTEAGLMAEDARTRWSSPEQEEGSVAPRPDNEIPLEQEQLQAIERAVSTAAQELADAGWTGGLSSLVLPGEVMAPGHSLRGINCGLLILCSPFDDSAERHLPVWGFGYTDTQLVLTLDGHRVEEPPIPDAELWRVQHLHDPMSSQSNVHVSVDGQRVRGISIGINMQDQTQDYWCFHTSEGPRPC